MFNNKIFNALSIYFFVGINNCYPSISINI